jgi:low temperature requirement protein LtrA
MPYHFLTAVMALTVDILVPLTRGRGNTKRYLNVQHMQERLGLFLMLVLGESMIVVALVGSANLNVADQWNVVLSGIVFVIALWWLYFEFSDRYQGDRPKHFFGFLHGHGLVYLGILGVSVGYKLLLENSSQIDSLYIVTGSMAVVALGLLALRTALHGTSWVSRQGWFLFALVFSIGLSASLIGVIDRATSVLSLLSILFVAAAVWDTQRSLVKQQL